LRRGIVSLLLTPKAGGSSLIGYPLLLIRYTFSCTSYVDTVIIHPQSEEVPYHGDRDPHNTAQN